MSCTFRMPRAQGKCLSDSSKFNHWYYFRSIWKGQWHTLFQTMISVPAAVFSAPLLLFSGDIWAWGKVRRNQLPPSARRTLQGSGHLSLGCGGQKVRTIPHLNTCIFVYFNLPLLSWTAIFHSRLCRICSACSLSTSMHLCMLRSRTFCPHVWLRTKFNFISSYVYPCQTNWDLMEFFLILGLVETHPKDLKREQTALLFRVR